jgi:hypothetical protein
MTEMLPVTKESRAAGLTVALHDRGVRLRFTKGMAEAARRLEDRVDGEMSLTGRTRRAVTISGNFAASSVFAKTG